MPRTVCEHGRDVKLKAEISRNATGRGYIGYDEGLERDIGIAYVYDWKWKR